MAASSAAYDLSAYELPQRKRQPELKAVRNPRRVISKAFSPSVMSSFAIIVTLVSLMVYNQVQLNEVSGEINELNAQMRELQSENIKMSSELESTIGMSAIGEQAINELGMHRLDKHQVEYVYLQQEDKIQLTEASPELPLTQKIKLAITSAIGSLQEYIEE